MSMNTYPIIDNGLIINYELAAHIQLALDKAGKNNKSVPKEIQELLDNGTFDQKAESFDMPCDYNEISIVRDALSELDNISYVYCPDFEGAYETLFDKLTDNPIYENINQSSSKMKACLELLCNYKANHQKVLLFSSFTKVFDLMEEELKLNGIRYFVLTGATSKEVRRDLVHRFQEGEADVFLISLKAGGTGLNLTAAQAVIHFDPWWNLSAQNQATDRAYRIGQHNNVMVHQLIMKESIEEKIQILQAKKKELADMFVENSEGNISSLSTEDLKELFSL